MKRTLTCTLRSTMKPGFARSMSQLSRCLSRDFIKKFLDEYDNIEVTVEYLAGGIIKPTLVEQ